MRTAAALLAMVLGPLAVVVAEESFRVSLREDTVGQLPPGWIAAKTGEGAGSVWKVLEDATATDGRVLAPTSAEGPNRLFNLCVATNTRFADVDLSVRFKAIAGKLDQGGGPVWRYADANNYYIARMNPLEDNFRVYKVVAGKRTQLGSAEVKAPAGQWHRIRIVHAGDRIRGYLDGKPMFDVRDATFPGAGNIGLWTKADAVTHFDGLEARLPEASSVHH